MWFRIGLLGLALTTQLAAAEPPATTESPAPPGREYVIGVEDALRISVWGESALNLLVRVRPDGKISLPLVNDLVVEGMTAEQLKREVTARLEKYIRDPNVTVIVEEINSYRVYVLGEVRTQGVLQFRRPTRILQAIAAAGGLTEFSKKEIVLIREQDGVERRVRVDYRKLLAGEGGADNVLLRPGDTLVVN